METQQRVGTVGSWWTVSLPRHTDGRGSLSAVEADKALGFEIRRVYYLYDVPGDAVRGAHGHRRLEQLLVAVHGSFRITLDDGFSRDTVVLDDPARGLRVGPMVWRELTGFSPGAVALVLASRPYEDDDYYRDHDTFLREARRQP
ncbi:MULTISPECIES: sugar 3,4-ketoisomerase [Streptomyces]|uniref:TDP-4-oxo-6-deoxy-alpha-D-glucose-3, 4-oxoisomerase n=2 Tax=Streptomyces TaxID=1883 RepID=A0A1D8FWV6_9ACTN|nr:MULTISPECIES: FdtA/QdtA family cupin domain-containing protein [Streptomyces]AOT57690.1 TDP-4-oxo-6-deoxy-alpha-D-glucose-3,4-oxoisomerase [Streptomyces rubrolavendulae]KAF0651620.1 hypothetical protein K701_01440 [Streptomyces fradiae ATCC 10745 = DSM 40063]OSY50318.1 TDP-4-oxo-6-deoxy-alpha-D-glucose-3,4-oxoisomerase [Streptomyces fradiae ATCC 10745 = DSM 40063]QEV11060.1 WxcM-like domain-containing protein [Streptomyces fradiae ATCC 10745 = DSM 40063]UQS29220.1 WxcM-like domain-containin